MFPHTSALSSSRHFADSISLSCAAHRGQLILKDAIPERIETPLSKARKLVGHFSQKEEKEAAMKIGETSP